MLMENSTRAMWFLVEINGFKLGLSNKLSSCKLIFTVELRIFTSEYLLHSEVICGAVRGAFHHLIFDFSACFFLDYISCLDTLN